MKRLIVIFIFLLLVFPLAAQEHNHDHSEYHLAAGIGGTYLFSENRVMPGIHFHAMKNLGHKFSAGLGLETLVDEHSHYSVTLLAGYSPIENLIVEAGPGLTFSKHENDWEQSLSAHIECIYEINLHYFHVGPMVGLGIDHDETHATLGIHLGIGIH